MIGRKKEVEELCSLYNSNKSELVAVYGRRRVGKTYLVDQTFKGKISFRHAGLSPLEMQSINGGTPLRKQLKHFYNSLISQGMKKSRCPADWLDAFFMLQQFLEAKDNGGRQVVFLDELPWMDTQRSGFVTAFEGFWNNWACHRENIMVIVCGSSTSWILDKLINNHGGLYDRVTYEIPLSPFTLRECEEYFEFKGIKLSRYDIVCAYMIFGGIPYYLNYFKRGLVMPQNVDNILFSPRAKLKFEYDRLFSSLFSNSQLMKDIISALSEKNCGLTRKEISKKTGYMVGGTLSESLSALIASDFIIKYNPFGLSKKEPYYKLIDPFCMFYNKFVSPKGAYDDSFWMLNHTSQKVISWRGFAFETVCFNHIEQIRSALGISGVSSTQSAWSKRADDEEGTQIDLIIERKDNVVNMCEIKFYGKEFVVNKAYDKVLRNRQELLENVVGKKNVIHNTLITTFGLKYNEYSGIFDNVITLEDLFK